MVFHNLSSSFRLSITLLTVTVAFDIMASPWLISMVHSISPMP